MLTYAATLGASIVVWIAERFTDEHRKVIEWLNEKTTDEISIFGVRPEVLQIDTSNPAVRFTVIVEPNEIVRQASVAKAAGDISESQQLQLDFWTMFQKRLLERKVVASAQTPGPKYWFDVPLGRSRIFISNVLNTWDGKMGIRIYIGNRVAASALPQLEQDRIAIEKEIGTKLEWNPRPEKRDKVIALYRDVDLENRAAWPEYVEWLVDMTAKFRKAFQPRVKNLKLLEPVAAPAA